MKKLVMILVLVITGISNLTAQNKVVIDSVSFYYDSMRVKFPDSKYPEVLLNDSVFNEISAVINYHFITGVHPKDLQFSVKITNKKDSSVVYDKSFKMNNITKQEERDTIRSIRIADFWKFSNHHYSTEIIITDGKAKQVSNVNKSFLLVFDRQTEIWGLDFWINKNAELVDGSQCTSSPRRDTFYNFNMDLSKIKYKKVFRLNRVDDNGNDYIPGGRGGDEITTPICDLRYAFASALYLEYQRGGKEASSNLNRNRLDNSLLGPESRIAVYSNDSISAREPDELVIEYIAASEDKERDLINVPDSAWKNFPRRKGATPVNDNSLYALFGGGGFRKAYHDDDKDSSLNYSQGLTLKFDDVGCGNYFKPLLIPIQDTMIRKGGLIRYRIKVMAKNNSEDGSSTPDDNDDFYIREIMNNRVCECADISTLAFKVVNKYSILPNDGKVRLKTEILSAVTRFISSPTFTLSYKIKHKNAPDSDTNFCYGMEELPFLSYTTIMFLPVSSFKLSEFQKYLKQGKNEFQVIALHRIPGGDLIEANDTIYSEFSLYLDDSYGYDDPNIQNAVPLYTKFVQGGISLHAYSEGDNSIINAVGDKDQGQSGQIAMKFDLSQKDTVLGLMAYFATMSAAPDEVYFAIYKDSCDMPGSMVPGAFISSQKHHDDLKNQPVYDEYCHYLFKKPLELDSGVYWAAIIQPGEAPLNLGASDYRAGMMTMIYDSAGNGKNGMCLYVDDNLRRYDSVEINGKKIYGMFNENIFMYQNDYNKGQWVKFAPNIGNPAYSHLNHSGLLSDSVTKSYSRGTFMPMLRVYMGLGNKTAVEEAVNNKNEISLSPNPAKDFLQINSNILSNGNIKLEIIDELGNIVYKENTQNNIGNYSKVIDVRNLPQGVYFVRIIHNGKVISEKFSIVK